MEIYLFILLNAPDTRPAKEYTPIYKADTTLDIINPKPTITPLVAPKVDPPSIAAISINTVDRTPLAETPNKPILPIPIILKVINRLRETISSGLMYILFLLFIKNFVPNENIYDEIKVTTNSIKTIIKSYMLLFL